MKPKAEVLVPEYKEWGGDLTSQFFSEFLASWFWNAVENALALFGR